MTVRTVRPARVQGRLRAPSSKSYTHRALVAGFLAGTRCDVLSPLDSEDTRATRDGLRVLGAQVTPSAEAWHVSMPERGVPQPRKTIHCAESGTTFRFLAAVASLSPVPVKFDGAPRLAARPMSDLFRALRKLGASVQTRSSTRSLPCEIHGPMRAGRVAIRGDVSSQFTSALLMVLPRLAGRSELRVSGPTVSRPYVDATRAVLERFGVRVRRAGQRYVTHGPQTYRTGRFRVPGDASSAAYLWAAGAATGGDVEISGVPADLPQADLAILPILSAMGARVTRTSRYVGVRGPISEPISVDLTDSPDLFPLVSVLAALVPGRRSQLRGAPHLGFKESDRRIESIRLARALGAEVVASQSRIEIRGSATPLALNCPSLKDHRVVMSAAVAGLASRGVSRVGRAEAVSKSFPGFWNAVRDLTAGEGGTP